MFPLLYVLTAPNNYLQVFCHLLLFCPCCIIVLVAVVVMVNFQRRWNKVHHFHHMKTFRRPPKQLHLQKIYWVLENEVPVQVTQSFLALHSTFFRFPFLVSLQKHLQFYQLWYWELDTLTLQQNGPNSLIVQVQFQKCFPCRCETCSMLLVIVYVNHKFLPCYIIGYVRSQVFDILKS